MALEPGIRRPSVSPSSSGRASPIPRKWGRLGEDEPLTKDKAYRRYAAGVERSLSLFDTTLEDWADYISFLGRLLKALQAPSSNPTIIPYKSIVAKRLAQCLNPQLPSGVHQKTLEVYNHIFTQIGREGLSRDLSLYLPGLSSTLSFASLTVRGPFLGLLEAHFLKVDPSALRPALKAIILALLPGLEEETSEDFERTLKLVDDFKSATRSDRRDEPKPKQDSGDEYFWQCFFLASITSNTRRLGALAYLVRNLPRLGAQQDQSSLSHNTKNGTSYKEARDFGDQAATMVTSPEPGLLLRCFAAGLTDEQLLIQRGFLDLLVTHLPLHAKVLQNLVKPEDLELLMLSASSVVARRDMSLNRRLWSWLLGPEPASGTDGNESPTSVSADPMNASLSSRTRYFEDYGLQPLTRAILKTVNQNHRSPAERARPFRICLSLMDRWEIGGLVVPEIFLPIVSSVRKYEGQAATKDDFKEVLRSASVFFDGVESGLIWGEIVGLISKALDPSNVDVRDRIDKLALVKFILSHFNVREEEMLVIHAPLAAVVLAIMLQDFDAPSRNDPASSGDGNQDNILALAVSIATDLVDLVPERAYTSRPSTSQSVSQEVQDDALNIGKIEVLERIRAFYMQDQGNLDIASRPFPTLGVCQLLVRETASIISKSLEGSMSSADIAAKTRLQVKLISKAPMVSSLEVDSFLSAMHSTLSPSGGASFSSFSSVVSVVVSLSHRGYISSYQVSGLIEAIVRAAWSYLSPSHPKYHVETARALWTLQTSLPTTNHEIEACLSNLIEENAVFGPFSQGHDADPGRRFSILWTHVLQESGGLGRRGSRSSIVESKNAFSTGTCEVMLGRPLFLLLDALLDEKTQLFVTVRSWLQTLVGADRLCYIIASKFSDFSFLCSPFIEGGQGNDAADHNVYTEDDDLDQCLYYLQTLANVLRWSSDTTWAVLAEKTIQIEKSYPALYAIVANEGDISLQEFFIHVCLCAVNGRFKPQEGKLETRTCQLHRTALSVLHQLLLNPYAAPISKLNLEHKLIDLLLVSLAESDPFIQVSLLDVIFAALKIKTTIHVQTVNRPTSPIMPKRVSSQDMSQGLTLLSTNDQRQNTRVPSPPPPPASLIQCLQAGFEAPSSRPVLDSWVSFLSECLPLYSETMFQVLLPLIETLCVQVEKTFDRLRGIFQDQTEKGHSTPETTLLSLLNALEQVLARGHARLVKNESKIPSIKSPDQPQGFFGNMVSGVFSSDANQSRTATANDRLTVLLSFQDVVRISFKIWSWGGLGAEGLYQDAESAASFSYTSLRMRNRARRLLEHLFAAEPLECLETVIETWQRASINIEDYKYTAVFNLLHVLDGSRPKHTIPAIFDAIYSRTNPSALELSRKSTLTSTLQDTDLVVFLVEYARSLEDDAMDEIWTDCMTFLKDVLTNPFPHRQILPSLLEFATILGEKVDNTNFGEQKRMRKELGDLFLRLLTASFTTKPLGFSESTSQGVPEKHIDNDVGTLPRHRNRAEDIVGILASIMPSLPKVLVEPERILSATNTISASVIGPTFRSKVFPDSVTKSTLVLLYQIARLPNTHKSWKKDLGDAFNDARFFANPTTFLESDWLPLLRQWSLSDKDRMPDLLSRLNPPTTAGIVFGVGATSARLEADRKTQLNLRRIATLILAAADDTFVTELQGLEEKLVELLSATTTSSPSSTTRGDIYMVLRALALKINPIHLSLLWPTINEELYKAISSVVAAEHSQTSDAYNNFSVLQACKLLDVLLCIAPDDFQLHEWLFINDTIDAVYRPSNYHPSGLIDELAEELGSTSLVTSPYQEQHVILSASKGHTDKTMARPLIGPGGVDCTDVDLERRDELIGKVLRPFFAQLSIFAFERTYEMGKVDWENCRRGLMVDLFDERDIVKAL